MSRKLIPICVWTCWLFLVSIPAYSQTRPYGFHLPEKVNSVKIPVHISHNLILVPVRINNSLELNFIMDTGVRTSLLIEPMVLGLMQLDSLKPIRVRGLGTGAPIEAGLAEGIKIELPGVVGEDLRMIIMPPNMVSYSSMFGRPVVGLIGYDFLKNFVVEINYQQEYIKLYRPEAFKLKGSSRKWQKFRLRFHRSKPYVNAHLTASDGQKHLLPWLIDTGASQALSIYYQQFPLPDKTIRAFIGKGLSGEIYGDLGRVPQLELGNYTFEYPVAGFPDSLSVCQIVSQRGLYATIGSEILSRFVMVLDYPHRKMYLKKNSSFRKPFEFNLSGIELEARGARFDQYFVSYVRPESPADETGILAGDQIIEISGIDAKDVEDLSLLHGFLNRKANAKICLKVLRGNEVMRKCMVLEPDI
ncbi:MAG: aspartyl protease family protein [Bacteroidota bacterium]